MDRPLTREQIEALEELIDSTDMGEVLQAISDICYQKAEHIRENWHDEQTARAWSRLGAKIEKIT